eukprot:gene27394-33085_t
MIDVSYDDPLTDWASFSDDWSLPRDTTSPFGCELSQNIDMEFDLLVEQSSSSSASSKRTPVDLELVPTEPNRNTKPPSKRSRSYQPLTPEAREERNRRRRRPAHLSRIVRSDLRRQLPLILRNVFNMHDRDMMKDFLEQFCVPSCQLVDLCPRPYGSVQFAPLVVLAGREPLLQYVSLLPYIAPDWIIEIQSAEIRCRADFSSQIVCKVQNRVTAVYKPPLSATDVQLSRLLHSPQNCIVRTVDGLRGRGPQARAIDELLEKHYCSQQLDVEDLRSAWFPLGSGLLDPPIALRMDSYMIVEVGADMAIRQFDFVDSIAHVSEYLKYGAD